MPLNPVLYNTLTAIFGAPPKISNEGMPFSYELYNTPYGWKMKASGEAYAVCCPDCGDTRHRLFFNHRYGTLSPDPRMPGVMLDLAFCQHEQMKKPKWYKVFGDALSDPMVMLQIQEQTRVAESALQKDEVFGNTPDMGEVTPLTDMPQNHQAVQYLLARGYNPTYLTQVYGACYTHSHPIEKVDRMAKGRITFPFYINGELKTWQSRLPFDTKAKFPPKWYFPPGQKWPWGYDIAKQFPTCILCEGILSAVNFGPAGVSVGGKTLTFNTRKLIKETWKYAVVALDPEAGINRKGKSKPDFQERMVKALVDDGLTVFQIAWTEGDDRDPGDYGPVGCRQLLQHSCPSVLEMLPYYRAV